MCDIQCLMSIEDIVWYLESEIDLGTVKLFFVRCSSFQMPGNLRQLSRSIVDQLSKATCCVEPCNLLAVNLDAKVQTTLDDLTFRDNCHGVTAPDVAGLGVTAVEQSRSGFIRKMCQRSGAKNRAGESNRGCWRILFQVTFLNAWTKHTKPFHWSHHTLAQQHVKFQVVFKSFLSLQLAHQQVSYVFTPDECQAVRRNQSSRTRSSSQNCLAVGIPLENSDFSKKNIQKKIEELRWRDGLC